MIEEKFEDSKLQEVEELIDILEGSHGFQWLIND